jgi:ABC-2 type transport system ATP-binding protein
MNTAFDVQNVVKRYGSTTALSDVSLSVSPGELVGLLGPNGAGKSSLVKIGCGLLRATSGRVLVCGATAGSAEARSALGYLAELFRFPPWLTAEEVLELHQRLIGSDNDTNERASLLELVGLEHARGRRVAAMSKGMQQRLGIAQALVGSPRLLLLDEPTSALDPAGRRAVRGILEEIRNRGIGVLLNSHLLQEIELVCDRVVILSRGRIVAQGTPGELAAPRGVEIETDSGLQRFPDISRSEIPRVVTELAGKGARIYGVKAARPSLEDVYLDAVDGEIG